MGIEDFPTMQGEYLSFAEIKPKCAIVGGLDFRTKDFAAIDFDDSLVPSKVRGAGPGILGRTVGIYDCNASMSMYHASAVAFESALQKVAQSLGHNSIGLVKFDLIINWSPIGGLGLVYTTSIIGARMQTRSQKGAAGSADQNTREMVLSILRVEEYDPVTGATLTLVG